MSQIIMTHKATLNGHKFNIKVTNDEKDPEWGSLVTVYFQVKNTYGRVKFLEPQSTKELEILLENAYSQRRFDFSTKKEFEAIT